MEPTIVLVIPGPWTSPDEFTEAFVKGQKNFGSDFLPIGKAIVNAREKFHCAFSLCEAGDDLQETFSYQGQGRIPSADLKKIGQQQSVAVLEFSNPKVREARLMMKAAALTLRAGGVAVMVESSGVAHERDRWLYYADDGGMLCLYDAYVTLIGGDEFNYTCGMHAFGLPDASVTTDYPIKEAPSVLNTFNQWQLLEQPTIIIGQIFATGLEEQKFIVTHEDYGYPQDNSKNNPFGRYLLRTTDQPFPDDPHFKHRDQPLFMGLKKEDTEKCREKAQATFSYFYKHFNCPYEYGIYLVKIPMVEGGERSYIWLFVTAVEEGRVEGQFFEVPQEFTSVQVGDRRWIDVPDIYDWSIRKNGTLIGGYTSRLQRKNTPPRRRQLSDLYVGSISYLPASEFCPEDAMAAEMDFNPVAE